MAKQANFQVGYTVTQEGDKRHIAFRGDGLSWAAYILLPIFVPFVLFSILAGLPSSFWPVPVLLFVGIVFLLYRVFQTQKFTMSPASIIKDGTEYNLARVSEVLIDNPADKNVSYTAQSTYMMSGGGVAGTSMAAMGNLTNATTSALTGAAVAMGQSSAKRRYRVRIRYGSKVVTLARNLKENHAISIFNLLTEA